MFTLNTLAKTEQVGQFFFCSFMIIIFYFFFIVYNESAFISALKQESEQCAS